MDKDQDYKPKYKFGTFVDENGVLCGEDGKPAMKKPDDLWKSKIEINEIFF